jgi:putative flippase GtrA
MLPERYVALRSHARERAVNHRAWMWLTRTHLWAKFTKYALGSVAGFIAGAIPNWILNRRWAWQQTGRAPARQVVGYVGISILVLVTTSLATGWANSEVQSIPSHHGLRVLIVTGTYIAVTIFWFFAKFVIYDYWVFSERSRIRAAFRSLRQVPRTARANRIP